MPAEDVLSINNPEQLAEVESISRGDSGTPEKGGSSRRRRIEHLKISIQRASTSRSMRAPRPAFAEERALLDGEIIVKLDEDVRGRDCFIVQSTCAPVNENLMELLIWIDCLRRASARRITAVIPYFGYARQDRKDEGRVPITAKMVANLIAAAGADRVLSLDLHAAQIQGFFDIPVDHLSAAPVIAEYILEQRDSFGPLAVVSPDVGNVKVANMYADLLGCDLAIIDKRRRSADDVTLKNLIGEVEGCTVLMFDDMVSTAARSAGRQARDRAGATDVIACATWSSSAAIDRIADSPRAGWWSPTPSSTPATTTRSRTSSSTSPSPSCSARRSTESTTTSPYRRCSGPESAPSADPTGTSIHDTMNHRNRLRN